MAVGGWSQKVAQLVLETINIILLKLLSGDRLAVVSIVGKERRREVGTAVVVTALHVCVGGPRGQHRLCGCRCEQPTASLGVGVHEPRGIACSREGLM